MTTISRKTLLAATLVLASIAWANSAPQVTNVTASQRPDDSKLVDIYYNLSDADGDSCTVWAMVSDDGGATWNFPAWSFSGHVGPNVSPGSGKHITWDAGADMGGRMGSNFEVRVSADDGRGPATMVVVPAGWFPYQRVTDPSQWVYVPTFLIDKYEVTNQFYCQFLNATDPNSTRWTSNMEIARGGTSGNYYYTVTPGYENYPIRDVNRYDADAFAAWRSNLEGLTYRLPTEAEWEKAAAWDPTNNTHYLYGFHRNSIDCSWCNYNNCVGRSTPVGYYDGTGSRNNAKSFYGCYDLSGNVWEWTHNSSYLRGGAWNDNAACTTVYRYGLGSWSVRSPYFGFRLVMDPG